MLPDGPTPSHTVSGAAICCREVNAVHDPLLGRELHKARTVSIRADQ